MRERLSELGFTTWFVVLGVVALLVLSLGVLGIQRIVYPRWLAVQRASVEQSKSFTDSNNNMLQTYILEYARLETKIVESDEAVGAAYKTQQRAILTKMCTQISTMQVATVNPATLSWLASKGAPCR